jgi:hypothetical protein
VSSGTGAGCLVDLYVCMCAVVVDAACGGGAGRPKQTAAAVGQHEQVRLDSAAVLYVCMYLLSLVCMCVWC